MSAQKPLLAVVLDENLEISQDHDADMLGRLVDAGAFARINPGSPEAEILNDVAAVRALLAGQTDAVSKDGMDVLLAMNDKHGTFDLVSTEIRAFVHRTLEAGDQVVALVSEELAGDLADTFFRVPLKTRFVQNNTHITQINEAAEDGGELEVVYETDPGLDAQFVHLSSDSSHGDDDPDLLEAMDLFDDNVSEWTGVEMIRDGMASRPTMLPEDGAGGEVTDDGSEGYPVAVVPETFFGSDVQEALQRVPAFEGFANVSDRSLQQHWAKQTFGTSRLSDLL